VNIPAGETSVNFSVTAAAVSQSQTATLKATVDDISQTDALTLSPAGTSTSSSATTLTRLNCASSALSGSTYMECSVYLSAPAASQTSVALLSNNKDLLTPASVNIPAGVSATPFKVTTSAPSTKQTATLTATLNGMSQSAAITLNPANSSSAAEHGVQLSWNAPASTSDQVAGYHVYRAPSGGSNFVLLAPSPDAQTSYDDTTVTSGQKYDYIVRSVDSGGMESGPSNKTTVTVP
jgi:hypothetical protein